MVEALQQVAVALGLGFLVGLQRERQAGNLAGIRTFPLVTLLGALCAMTTEAAGGSVVAAGAIGLSALLVVENLTRLESSDRLGGPTTEVAALVMYFVGALVVLHEIQFAIVIGGGVALLLHWKRPLHTFADRIDDTEVRSLLRLALIGLVVLPVLPDRSFGPLQVLNPFRVWLMVVLIVGISLAGYLAQKFIGSRAGTFIAGLLGGVVSSTATSVATARQARRGTASVRSATVIVLIASTVVFARVFFEIAVVAPDVLLELAPPLAVTMAWMAALCAAWSVLVKRDEEEPAEPEDPSNLGAAIVFGLLYAIVLVGLAVAERHFGDTGLYIVAVLSGLTDVDAITLSTATMIQGDEITTATGWRMILIGCLSNLVFKGAAVVVLGTKRLGINVAALFGASTAGGALVLWLWP